MSGLVLNDKISEALEALEKKRSKTFEGSEFNYNNCLKMVKAVWTFDNTKLAGTNWVELTNTDSSE